MALPLSFAAGVVPTVAAAFAGPPWAGLLYLIAVSMSAGVAYFLVGSRGWENEAPTPPPRRFGEERAWYGEVEHLRGPEHEDADGASSP